MSPFLDPEALAAHRRQNVIHSVLLVAGLTLLTMISALLIWSWPGALLAGVFVVLVSFAGSRVPPETVMRLYRAVPVDPRHGATLHRLVEILADRAELDRHPRLYVIPSTTMNAFATGTRDHAAIAVTEGLLRRLDLRQTAAVIAHEMSHIRNNDLQVMAMADTLTRFMQMMAYLGLFLAVMNVVGILLDLKTFSWIAIGLLYLAPMLASLLQLGLSRTREYDADVEAAGLTGDPAALASALELLERYQGRYWEDLVMPIPARRIPYPSLLRSHPETSDRIARLRELEARPHASRPIRIGEGPLFTLVGHAPATMAPRIRPFGFWY